MQLSTLLVGLAFAVLAAGQPSVTWDPLNTGAATVATGPQLLAALDSNVGDITLASEWRCCCPPPLLCCWPPLCFFAVGSPKAAIADDDDDNSSTAAPPLAAAAVPAALPGAQTSMDSLPSLPLQTTSP